MAGYRKGWTKGPHEVRRAKHMVDNAFDYAIGADINDHKVCIAETFGRGDQSVFLPAEANAHLLANAERLFEALEEVVSAAEAYNEAIGRLVIDPHTLREARAALLAADGQEPGNG